MTLHSQRLTQAPSIVSSTSSTSTATHNAGTALPAHKAAADSGHASAPHKAALPINLAHPADSPKAAAALRIVQRLLGGFVGTVRLQLWDGAVHQIGNGIHSFTLVLHDPSLLRELVHKGSPIVLADAYFRKRLDIEGDFYSALCLKHHFEKLRLHWRDKLALLWDAWQLPRHPTVPRDVGQRPLEHTARNSGVQRKRTQESDQAAITFHYDVSNAFYATWLDEQRVYSCAYFKTANDSLDLAQRQKLDHICRKLRLRAGETLLDIGCGWGALVCWAAIHYGVRAHGITLSVAQFDYAQQRIAELGLSDQVTVELRDYRDLTRNAVYDKVASVGMLEHVGLAHMEVYLNTVRRVLKPNGLFLNHGITHDEEGWNRTTATEFINRYVFPDGEFDCVSNIQLGMERVGFEIQDVEALRRHYALTLRHWVARLEHNRSAALREVDESTYRIWRLYMAACALEFEAGGTGVYQILASVRCAPDVLPLTRGDLYANRS